jgi:signal transduction histidine kinase
VVLEKPRPIAITASILRLGRAGVYGVPTCPRLLTVRVVEIAGNRVRRPIEGVLASHCVTNQLVPDDDSPTLAARLLAAADAERRRIEGDLHDGAQQDLVALAVNLQLARQLADTDLAAAKSLLDELRRDVQETLDGLRALSHAVYPSLLPLRGLADALRTVPAPVETTGLARYPLEVEETVYFCCLELLRHADASATGRVWEEAGSVCFAITGDVGDEDLSVVRDRVAAVGGRVTTSAGETRGAVPF